MLYEYGPGNGTLLLLPIDQGMEHGPVDFFDNPDSIDPDYEYRLAIEGNYSGIALHYVTRIVWPDPSDPVPPPFDDHHDARD